MYRERERENTTKQHKMYVIACPIQQAIAQPFLSLFRRGKPLKRGNRTLLLQLQTWQRTFQTRYAIVYSPKLSCVGALPFVILDVVCWYYLLSACEYEVRLRRNRSPAASTKEHVQVINAACMVVSVGGSAMHLQLSCLWALFEEWCVQLLTQTNGINFGT